MIKFILMFILFGALVVGCAAGFNKTSTPDSAASEMICVKEIKTRV
ncbi:MAG: hypothetical protein ACI9FB_001278 [Candidatus Azotimanducaceae bacterium]|jgi:hypothetical protein